MPLMFGMSAVVLEPFTPAGWMAAVERWRVSFTIPVSSQLSALLPHFLAEPARLASLRVLVSSSAQIAEDLKRRLAALLACQFHEIYGASEVGVISNLSPDHPAGKMASVGLPLAGIDLRILGDDGAVLPVGRSARSLAAPPPPFSAITTVPTPPLPPGATAISAPATWAGSMPTGFCTFLVARRTW